MRMVLLLAPLLSIPSVLGSQASNNTNTTATATAELTDADIKYHIPVMKVDWGHSNWGGFDGQNGGWQYAHGFPVKVTDKFTLLRYNQPNCQGKIIKGDGDDMEAHSHKSFKKWKKNQSMRYALPSNGHLSRVDITFYDDHKKRWGQHFCTGNIILKLDGAMGETMDGDRYPCHPIPQAKCMKVGHK